MTAEQVILFIVFPAAGYLLGSVPFAWVIGKRNGVDIRTVGSKNIGATNLGRTLGRKYFFQAFFLDAGKGFVPVLAASLLVRHWNALQGNAPAAGYPIPHWSPLLTAAGCFLGHLYPIWLQFKGGKGVATGFGAVLGFWPLYTIAGLAGGLIFVIVLMVYRTISLASITGAVAFALLVALLATWDNRYVDSFLTGPDRHVVIAVAAAFAAMIVWRHRANIRRLMNGTEPQWGQKQIDKAKFGGK